MNKKQRQRIANYKKHWLQQAYAVLLILLVAAISAMTLAVSMALALVAAIVLSMPFLCIQSWYMSKVHRLVMLKNEVVFAESEPKRFRFWTRIMLLCASGMLTILVAAVWILYFD